MVIGGQLDGAHSWPVSAAATIGHMARRAPYHTPFSMGLNGKRPITFLMTSWED